MRLASSLAISLVTVLLAACTGGADGGTISSSSSSSGGSSSGGSSSGGSSSGEPTGVTARCAEAQTSVVEGTLGGQAVNVTGTTRSWSWVNVGNPPKFDGSFEGGSVHLEWGDTIANNAVTAVTGATLTLTSGGEAGTFQSGQLVYDSPGDESWLKASITFDNGTATVCMRKSD